MSFFFYRQLSYDQQRAWLPSRHVERSYATHRRVSGEEYRRADVISSSIEDRIYYYAVKSAAGAS